MNGSSSNPYSNMSQRDYIGSNRYILPFFIFLPFICLSRIFQRLVEELIDKTILRKNSSIRKITFSNSALKSIQTFSSNPDSTRQQYMKRLRKFLFAKKRKEKREEEEETSYGFRIEVYRRIFAFHNALFNAVEILCSRWTMNERNRSSRKSSTVYLLRAYPRDFSQLNPFPISTSSTVSIIATCFVQTTKLFNFFDFSSISIE